MDRQYAVKPLIWTQIVSILMSGKFTTNCSIKYPASLGQKIGGISSLST